MTVISAKRIINPQKQRRCEDCSLLIHGQQIRLYGYAETGDPPFVIYCHPECVSQSSETQKKLLEDDVRHGRIPK